MNVYFVIGPSCAGKSTYIQKNLPDAIKIDLYDFQKDSNVTIENIVKSYEDCKNALIEAVKTGKDVVLEHTMLMSKRRPPYIEAVRQNCDCKLICIVLKPSARKLQNRQKKRYEYRPDITHAKEMLNILEIPSKDEGFDEIIIIED